MRIEKKFSARALSYGLSLLDIDGVMLYGDTVAEEPAFIQENTVDTTGAGDTFMGCCINYVLENGMDNLTKENLSEMLKFANAAASIITTRKGALKAMPTEAEIKEIHQMSEVTETVRNYTYLHITDRLVD